MRLSDRSFKARSCGSIGAGANKASNAFPFGIPKPLLPVLDAIEVRLLIFSGNSAAKI